MLSLFSVSDLVLTEAGLPNSSMGAEAAQNGAIIDRIYMLTMVLRTSPVHQTWEMGVPRKYRTM